MLLRPHVAPYKLGATATPVPTQWSGDLQDLREHDRAEKAYLQSMSPRVVKVGAEVGIWAGGLTWHPCHSWRACKLPMQIALCIVGAQSVQVLSPSSRLLLFRLRNMQFATLIQHNQHLAELMRQTACKCCCVQLGMLTSVKRCLSSSFVTWVALSCDRLHLATIPTHRSCMRTERSIW